MQASGSATTCRRMKECQNGGGSSDLLSALRMSASVMSKSKGGQPASCSLQGASCTAGKDGWWAAPPCLGVLG